MSLSYTAGCLVWVPDSGSGWVPGTVTDLVLPHERDTTSEVVLTVCLDMDPTSNKTFKFPAALLQPSASDTVSSSMAMDNHANLPALRNPPALESAEDLASLSNLNEPSVLHAIATRYMQHYPYTYSGIVLLSMNPFTPLNIYEPAMIKLYAGQKKTEREPHVFAIAEEALEALRQGDGSGGVSPTGAGDQTIIVSGESGAGKTVAAKYILRYFASSHETSQNFSASRKKTTIVDEGMSEIEKQILASNPIMEAFGNAKTTRNDNSSRFGKYIQVLFSRDNAIVGARIRTYLLERSRLTYQPELERNYHIFYQLLAGAPAQERKDLGLAHAPTEFNFLTGGGPASLVIPGVDDAKDFMATQSSLSIIGVSVERQWQIFRLLAALLHLGNIELTQTRSEASIADGDPALLLATSLLGVSSLEFKKWTVKKQLVTRNEKIVTALGSGQAIVVRDSVAKYIYSCLFQWLVIVVNSSLCGGDTAADFAQASKFIGVLDIYGFEHFTKNSFEQFCINWANEKLQQEFYAHVFKLEQEEYIREKINWRFIDFADNQACIQVIEGKMGILTLLDEESRLPAGSDSAFATKIYQQIHEPWQKAVFKKPRFNQNAFTIAHYAHDVTYDVEGFIDKNRDSVPDEHLALLQGSSNRFLVEVITSAVPSSPISQDNQGGTLGVSGSKRSATRKPTLGSIFKNSLSSLMETIRLTNVHYIRCIKPNEAKKAWDLDPQQVLSQLRACGVLETIRISCVGYPSRWEYAQFAERYHIMLSQQEWNENMELQDLCSVLLQKLLPDDDKYQLGATKIFFRAGALAFLEAMRSRKQYEMATTIQKYIRRRLAYKEYRKMRESSVIIQLWWKSLLAKRSLLTLKNEKLAVMLQQAIRSRRERVKYLHLRAAIIGLQSAIRRNLATMEREEKRKQGGAVQLQSLFRGLVVRNHYQSQVRRVVLLQSHWRRKLAARELKLLKTEAKSASKLKEMSYQLENKVVVLTQTLQKRTVENKELNIRIQTLADDDAIHKHRNKELQHTIQELTAKCASLVAKDDECRSLSAQKESLDAQLQHEFLKSKEREEEIQRLSRQLDAAAQSLTVKEQVVDDAARQTLEDKATINQLRSELGQLREQLSRSNALNSLTKGDKSRDMPPSPTYAHNGVRRLEHLAASVGNSERAPVPRRRIRRHSLTGTMPQANDVARDPNQEFKHALIPRASSVMYTQDIPLRPRDSQGLPLSTALNNVSDEILRLLEDEASLDDDVLQGLICQLKIPSPSLHTPPTAKEVLFPAHLISLISNEMWKQAMVPESERFLANVMQAIQQHIVTFKGDDVIIPGVFWLSNVQEILSFICVAEADASKGYAPGSDHHNARELDWEAYARLISVVKHDLDSLEYNIYHTFMLEIKKKLSKMVIPALIESQSLPGFITSDGSGRMLSKMLGGIGGNQQPAATMDDILNLLNRVWKCLKSYYMEESVMHQVITELLKLIGQISFNDLLMRRNFSSWKRAMQIQYNITRIEEWCKSHDMPEGLLQLEHLMQATKLLQLKKATLGDIDILFDVCWILSPTQVQKLISQYHTADYEVPLNAEILKAVAARVRPEDKNDQLLLTPETDDVGPYQLPSPREIAGLETYVPAWLAVPTVRRLAAFVA
ncbi:hypothetical protein I350_05942 [Cryptococcus amylolentus CBS 6273]|uniref:Myosin motor domain-containing protein n=1 Tax=Cryptococcus amylolentus CBS 6273 TaxID=1296118 RepID=A0A1E3JSL7_9TREE|nr:hypothetical protein I350_05942 [Cryptococcus amylolentus CBS 6273]